MHEWKRYDDDENVFVNQRMMKYGVVRDNATFTRTGKGLWFFVPLLLTAVVCILSYALTQHVLVALLMLVPCFAIDQWIWRKFVFEENMRKDLLAENDSDPEFTASYFNNTLGADTDGLIMYQRSDYGYTSAYLVTYEYGSLAEVSTNADREMIDLVKKPFLKQLQDHHLRYHFYNIKVKNGLSKGTMNLIQQNRALPKNSTLRIISSMQNEACACLEQNNNSTYRNYYLIKCDAMNDIDNFRDVVQGAIDSTLANSSLITQPHICDIEEINTFGKNALGINSFNINTLNRNIGRTNLNNYFIIEGFIDSNGIVHSPSELSFFPNQEEEVRNAFDHEKMLKEYHQAKKQKNNMEYQQSMHRQSKKRHNFLQAVARTQQKAQQKEQQQKIAQQKQAEKEQAERQQKRMLNRTKDFNEILRRTREKH